MASGPFTASFLWEDLDAWPFFIPEETTEEQNQLAKLSKDFFKNEVEPIREKIEAKENNIAATLLKKTGDLGLLMAEIPEKYQGLGLDKVTSTIISENMTGWSSFTVPFLCHTGIGTLPILYFGSQLQRQKYLPKLGSGEYVGAYALTEASSGSDALAAKTRATLSDDKKHYILNGEKQFITNAGFATIFTVFAKIDGEHFTAFIVEKDFPGVSTGKEEKKMGIDGSSTRPLILQDAKIPVENVLGEIGKGHRIAFNVLNVGRWKMAAGCMGACKEIIGFATKYTKGRKQFKKPLSSFQANRVKLAESAMITYMAESIIYRYASYYDHSREQLDKEADDYFFEILKRIKGLNIEASIAKIYCSEAFNYIADHAVQLYGGYGYIRDYPAEQFYRDSRINSIWEGTNDINRLLIPDTLLRRALKGSVDLMGVLQDILGKLKTGFEKSDPAKPMASTIDQVASLKRLTIYLSGVAAQKYMQDLREKQTVLVTMADFVIETFALESGLIRALKILDKFGQERASIPQAMVEVYAATRIPGLVNRARQALFDIADGNQKEFESYEKALARLIEPKPVLVEKLNEQIAEHVVSKGGYHI